MLAAANINPSNTGTTKGSAIMNREIMPAPSYTVSRSYHAELSSDMLDTHGELIDKVISFAFETLGANHFDLRVTPSNRFQGESFEPNTRTHR
jgi:hypothetical protein